MTTEEWHRPCTLPGHANDNEPATEWPSVDHAGVRTDGRRQSGIPDGVADLDQRAADPRVDPVLRPAAGRDDAVQTDARFLPSRRDLVHQRRGASFDLGEVPRQVDPR